MYLQNILIFITMFCGTENILQNIVHIQFEYEEYIVSLTKQCYGFELCYINILKGCNFLTSFWWWMRIVWVSMIQPTVNRVAMLHTLLPILCIIANLFLPYTIHIIFLNINLYGYAILNPPWTCQNNILCFKWFHLRQVAITLVS